MSESSLTKKMNEVMKRVSYIKKDASVGYGNNAYTALSHDAVTTKLQSLFAEIGIVHVSETEDVNLFTREVETKKGKMLRYEVSGYVKSTYINADDKNDILISKTFSMAFDSQDKAPGKMLSMGTKYNHLKCFMLASGDNEEDRVEEAILEKKALIDIKQELRLILESKNLFTPDAELYLKRMDYDTAASKLETMKNK